MQILFSVVLFSLIGCSSLLFKDTSPMLAKIVIPTIELSTQECEKFKEKLPVDLKRGYITQIEKDGESSREIKIFYYGKWNKRPLIIANGGPGLSSWSTYKEIGSTLDEEKIEYIFFDQKGTGCSSSYPQLDSKYSQVWKSYGSRGLASDIELLRQTLNLGDKITIFGHSFGAKIALSYAVSFPKSTQAILFYGDSFAMTDQAVVKSVINSLERRQNFLKKRMVANPKLEKILISIEQKYKSTPCVTDEKNIISVCGYDVIRDLGHYYSESTSGRIEQLLYQLDDAQKADEALREIVFKYIHWKLNPITVLLGFMDYQQIVDGQLVCELALKEVQIPSWALNSCSIVKYRLNFLKQISESIQPQLIRSEEIFKVLTANPSLKAYAFESLADLSSGEHEKLIPPSNWIEIELNKSDHFTYFKLEQFWNVVRKAMK